MNDWIDEDKVFVEQREQFESFCFSEETIEAMRQFCE